MVDASYGDPLAQIDAVNTVLADVNGAQDIPRILVFNKADHVDSATRARLSALYPQAHIVSSLSGEGIDALRGEVEALLPVPDVHVEALLPYTQGSLLSRIREYGRLETAEYRNDGVRIEAQVDSRLASQIVDASVD